VNYTTNFPGNENPISEGGKWTCGLAVGLDWTDPATNGTGDAFGTGALHAPPPYSDSIAHLSGFGPDHSVSITVTNTQGASGDIEVAGWLRCTITAHSLVGYECTVLNQTPWALYIVRCDGANGSFLILNAGAPVAFGSTFATTGDVFKFQMTGTVITGFFNGASIFTLDTVGDAIKYSSGNPGMSFYTQERTGGAPTDFCISNFTATDGLATFGPFSRPGFPLWSGRYGKPQPREFARAGAGLLLPKRSGLELRTH
jgi:hypothetical protein